MGHRKEAPMLLELTDDDRAALTTAFVREKRVR